MADAVCVEHSGSGAPWCLASYAANHAASALPHSPSPAGRSIRLAEGRRRPSTVRGDSNGDELPDGVAIGNHPISLRAREILIGRPPSRAHDRAPFGSRQRFREIFARPDHTTRFRRPAIGRGTSTAPGSGRQTMVSTPSMSSRQARLFRATGLTPSERLTARVPEVASGHTC